MQWAGKAIAATGREEGVFIEATGTASSQTADVLTKAAEANEARVKLSDLSLIELKRSISKDMAGLSKPILVVIDDIDRLTSDEIREVFQLIKANADFPNLIYLVLFDREIVAGALNGISGNRGTEFLDKIIQVLFHVPQPPLKDIHKIFCAGLDTYLASPGVSERWEAPRWTRVWPDGLTHYFTNLRSVYRFLSSFGFQVSHMKSGKTFELNPLDLVILETLRLFEPRFYELIPTNRSFFLGKWRPDVANEKDIDGKRREEMQRLLEVVPEGRRVRVREIIKHLFPGAFGHVHPDRIELLRGLRVGHEETFERYFVLGIPQDDISQADVDSLRDAAGDRNRFVEASKNLSDSGKLESALERLDVYCRTFPPTVFPAFISGLSDIGDELAQPDRPSFSFLDPLTFAWRQVYFGLKEIEDPQKRFELLRDGISCTRGVRLPVEIVNQDIRRQERSNHDYLISEDQNEALKSLVVERLRWAAEDGRLRAMPNLHFLLFRWLEFTSESEVKAWVTSQLKNSNDGLWILQTLLHTMTSSARKTTYTRYINLTSLERVCDSRLIDGLTSELEIDKLSVPEMRALRAFRYALIWRKEGRAEPQGGGGWGEEGPLTEDS